LNFGAVVVAVVQALEMPLEPLEMVVRLVVAAL
jgi:hypothetical protein